MGYQGVQFGRGFPEGEVLARELAARGLRFAELYSALQAGPEGLDAGAEDLARRDLARLIAAGGEVLVVAVHGGGERERWSGRVPDGAPRWPDRAFDDLADVLAALVQQAPDGIRVAFHPHTATWVEAPDEVEALAQRLPATGAGLCLDVGHYLVGGGDPVEAIARYRDLITHVHVKDVDGDVLRRMRAGEIDGFGAAVRERIFTEPGNGVLNLAGVLRGLDRIGYSRWLMVEQDSSWLPPAEAAMVGRRVVEFARRGVLAERAG
jgi:inosose dehydratase